jgi:heavy metal sensor kinase
MFWKRTQRIGNSLAVRLTLWLAGVVTLCLLATFAVVYGVMVTSVHDRLDKRLQHEVGEVASLFSLHGTEAIREALTRMAHAEGTDLVLYRVLDRDGRVLAESDTKSWPGLTVNENGLYIAMEGQPFFESVLGESLEGEARVIYAALTGALVLQVAVRTADELAHTRDLRRLFLTVGAVGLLFSIFLSWTIVRRALVPLHTMTRTALAIAQGDFAARVDPESRDSELDRLANAFNTMLNRIESFVRELTEMNDGLAHDLRTVLARIRLAADRLLASRPMSEEQETLAVSILEESDRLLDMLNTIMDLSEMNTGITHVRATEVDLAELLSELCEFFEITAKEKNVSLRLRTEDATLVSGETTRLRRAFANILDNALKYSHDGGSIDVHVRPNGEFVRVTIADTGSGIPDSAIPFIFDRFFRADQSRSSQGHGLGLSLAKAIVAIHGGVIDVQSKEGSGSIFTVSLPREPAAPK